MVELAGRLLVCSGYEPLAGAGTDLLERARATGSLVMRKRRATRAGELVIHRFLSVICAEALEPWPSAHPVGDRGSDL